MPRTRLPSIESFDLAPGRVLARKYEVINCLGAGWEGEVYLIRELSTGIERTAKLFFPQRNPRDRAVKFYAKKLHKLRLCPIVIQYNAQETISVKNIPVTILISEYVEGQLLSDYIKHQRGHRLHAYVALRLLYDLARGMECVHGIGEYHGDLHTDNIIVQRVGLNFDLKLVDLFQTDIPKRESIQYDTVDMITVFHEAVGGAKHYASQPDIVKDICCGLKHSLILKKFRTASQLRQYLERIHWD